MTVEHHDHSPSTRMLQWVQLRYRIPSFMKVIRKNNALVQQFIAPMLSGTTGFLRALSSPTRKLDHSRRQLKLLNRLRVERMGVESLEQDHTITLPLPESLTSFQQPASSSGTVGGFLHRHLRADWVACSVEV